ncbi:MAG: M23 family metallopeptidase [Deltaproteobacteria bacterium]|nr:M23 family metallopeptidase [Deltaproteobacteria bacterium]
MRTAVFASLLLLSFAADAVAGDKPPWRARRRRTDEGLLRPGLHQLKDPKRWPAEPESPPAPVDEARFRKALVGMCEGMASAKLLRRIAAEVLLAAAEAEVDPFLLGALVYRQSRCVPTLETGFGVGLLQIQARMLADNARGSNLRYLVREGDAWQERRRPIPPGALRRLKNSLINLRLGAAVLAMWQDQHPAIDEVFPGSVPHRSAVAHFGWGDIVRGTGGEDRALLARRRLINRYLDTKIEPRQTDLGFAVVSPLEGIPRLATSGLGDDREEGARAHRGLDIDATWGEPVASLADGVVSFAGFDLPGRAPPQPLPAAELATTERPPLGPGGLFVCVRHAPRIVSCYMHLQSYRVTVNDRVQAGQIIGNVGRTGAKVSGAHLHLEIHRDGAAIDPVPVLGPDFVIPPQETLAHDFAMASKKLRLRRERRARWKAHLAEKAAGK